MDYAKVPLHKRTRSQMALFFKQWNDEKKGKSGGGGGDGEGLKGTKNGVQSYGSSQKILKSDNVVKKKKNVVPVNVSLKRKTKLKKHKNVFRIEVDGDRSENEVEYTGEVYPSNFSSLRTGSGSVSVSGSQVGFKKGKKRAYMDDHEVVLASRSTGNSGGAKINEGKKTGVWGRIPSRGASKKKQDVSDHSFVDMEESEELEESEESEYSSEDDNDDPDDEDYAVGDLSSNSDDSSFCRENEYESEGDEEVNSGNECRVLNRETVVGKGKEKMVETGLKKSCRHSKVNCSSPYSVDDEREDGKGSSTMEAGSADGDEKDKSIEGGLKRRKVYGLDILVDCEKESIRESKTMAERLRSHSHCKSGKKSKFGTISCPFPVEEDDELHSSREHDSDSDRGSEPHRRKCKGESRKPTKGKKRMKDFDFFKILADSVWDKGDMPLEELVTPGDKALAQETLPLKFRFEDDDPNPPEKPEWQGEVDNLFAEMNLALRSSEIGSPSSSVVDNNESIFRATETNPATDCPLGKHHLILDEQIGIRCTFCSFVELEIKYIYPSFSNRHWERRDEKGFGKEDNPGFHELQFQNSGYESAYGSKGCSHTKGSVWDIIPGIKESMYPHQQEGFEFIWKNIAGHIHIEKLNNTLSDGGSGCIISHAPGTGKTRLTLVFLQTFMKLFPKCMPVIIAPRSMLLTWEDEFQKWKVDIPFHNLNKPEFSGQENSTAVNFFRQIGRYVRNKNFIRMVKMYSWRKGTSILGISYRLFEKLAGGGDKKTIRQHPHKEEIRKILLDLPGILVLDEGHTPRNDQTLIWKALSKIKTQRRIILSGTPFQNNFSELYNTLCLVNPKFADGITSKNFGDSCRKRGKKSNVARGKWASLTSSIGRSADDKLRELRAMIGPFVHVHKGTILQERLPGLRDSLVVLHPTDLQKNVLESIQGRKSCLELAHLVSLISVHPSLLLRCLYEKEESFVPKGELEKLKWDPDAGVKTKFLIELIRLSEALNEKVLVFSQFIDPLTFIRDLLKSHFDWTEGKEVLYMDGTLDERQRQSSIRFLNDPTGEVRVLLASTKACSEGINLVGASRVVLLDVVWNPSVERQAISRAYRLGQKRVVYIYHLITSGTMEGEKYARQSEKDRLSQLVFSATDRDGYKPEFSSTVSEDKILEVMVQHRKLGHMFEKIMYQPKESDLIQTFGLVDI